MSQYVFPLHFFEIFEPFLDDEDRRTIREDRRIKPFYFSLYDMKMPELILIKSISFVASCNILQRK